MFVSHSDISGTLNGFVKTCLVSRSDEFECHGQRSRSPGTKTRLALPSPLGSVRMVCAHCKHRAAVADGTTAWLRGVFRMWSTFGKTSLALVLLYFVVVGSPHNHRSNLSHFCTSTWCAGVVTAVVACVCSAHNVVTDVRQVPLTSLPSLQVVDMSHNRLSQLGNDSFPFITQLRRL